MVRSIVRLYRLPLINAIPNSCAYDYIMLPLWYRILNGSYLFIFLGKNDQLFYNCTYKYFVYTIMPSLFFVFHSVSPTRLRIHETKIGARIVLSGAWNMRHLNIYMKYMYYILISFLMFGRINYWIHLSCCILFGGAY